MNDPAEKWDEQENGTMWLILDGRGAYDPDRAAVIEVCRSAEEACRILNEGHYAADCVIDGPGVDRVDGRWIVR